MRTTKLARNSSHLLRRYTLLSEPPRVNIGAQKKLTNEPFEPRSVRDIVNEAKIFLDYEEYKENKEPLKVPEYKKLPKYDRGMLYALVLLGSYFGFEIYNFVQAREKIDKLIERLVVDKSYEYQISSEMPPYGPDATLRDCDIYTQDMQEAIDILTILASKRKSILSLYSLLAENIELLYSKGVVKAALHVVCDSRLEMPRRKALELIYHLNNYSVCAQEFVQLGGIEIVYDNLIRALFSPSRKVLNWHSFEPMLKVFYSSFEHQDVVPLLLQDPAPLSCLIGMLGMETPKFMEPTALKVLEKMADNHVRRVREIEASNKRDHEPLINDAERFMKNLEFQSRSVKKTDEVKEKLVEVVNRLCLTPFSGAEIPDQTRTPNQLVHTQRRIDNYFYKDIARYAVYAMFLPFMAMYLKRRWAQYGVFNEAYKQKRNLALGIFFATDFILFPLRYYLFDTDSAYAAPKLNKEIQQRGTRTNPNQMGLNLFTKYMIFTAAIFSMHVYALFAVRFILVPYWFRLFEFANLSQLEKSPPNLTRKLKRL
jgi:hypothetical protein